MCARESHDCYTVVMKREGILIGYLPRKLYWPCFLLLSLVALATSLLARAIACEGRCRDKGPFGIGKTIFGFRIDITSHLFALDLHLHLFS